MKKTVLTLLALAFLISGYSVKAQDNPVGEGEAAATDTPPPDPVSPPANNYISDEATNQAVEETPPFAVNIVGAQLMLGGAGMSEDWGDYGLDYENRARFAGGLGVFFKHHFNSLIALHTGLELVGKGFRRKDDEADETRKERLRVLEIPIGARFNVARFEFGFDLTMSIALFGEMWVKAKEDDTDNSDYLVTETHYNSTQWDNRQRFNICPRFTAGFKIPIGNQIFTPGILWEFELLNASKGDWADNNVVIRHINLMLTAAISFDLQKFKK